MATPPNTEVIPQGVLIMIWWGKVHVITMQEEQIQIALEFQNVKNSSKF